MVILLMKKEKSSLVGVLNLMLSAQSIVEEFRSQEPLVEKLSIMYHRTIQ